MTDERSVRLYKKYHVERLNDPTGKHKDCSYFVLDPKHDPFAIEALGAYIKACERTGYTELANDLGMCFID